MILRLTPKTTALVGETPAERQLLEKQVRAERMRIERDIFHRLRLLSRLTPPSVTTHTVASPCAEAQDFHPINGVE